MGISQLQEAAEGFAAKNDYRGGLPYFEELVRRLEGAPEEQRQALELVFIFQGVGHLQIYASTRDEGALQRALEIFAQTEADYPQGTRRHHLLMFRADAYRGLARWKEAAADLAQVLSPPLESRLSETQRVESLQKLCQAFYIDKNWAAGVPWFQRLLGMNRPDSRTMAAVALTEAWIAEGNFAAIPSLLPYLTGESPDRHDVGFNLKLLEGGDKLTAQKNYLQASLFYYLTLTKDELIDYWTRRVAMLERQLNLVKVMSVSGGDPKRIGELEVDILNAKNQLTALESIPTYTPELEWRKAGNFKETHRDWEAFWAYWRLAEDYPDRTEQIEDYYYAAFVQADLLNAAEKAEWIADKYLANREWNRYRREISVMFAGLLLRIEDYERLIRFATAYVERDPEDRFNPQLVYYLGSTYLKLERYEDLLTQFGGWEEKHPKTDMTDGLLYWMGLTKIFIEDYPGAKQDLGRLIGEFKGSPYFEDGQFRYGVAHFAGDDFEQAEKLFTEFVAGYPQSILRSEAELFLGDIASSDARVGKAIRHYEAVEQYTQDMGFINHAVFQKAKLLETNKRFGEMEAALRAYMDKYGTRGALTQAIFEQGRAYELMGQPEAMLKAYFDAILKYGNEPAFHGIDKILEAYPKKYDEYFKRFTTTVEFTLRLRNDGPWRESLLADRKLLYDTLNDHPALEETFREAILRDTAFREKVAANPETLRETEDAFRGRLAALPPETPVETFEASLRRLNEEKERTLYLRMQMTLDRLGRPVDTNRIYTDRDLEAASARTLAWMGGHMLALDNITLRPLIRRALERVINVYPDSEEAVLEALMTLGRLETVEANFDSAIAAYQRALERFATNPLAVQAAMAMGDVLFEAARYDEAAERYQDILKARAWRGEAWAEAQFMIGECHFREEKWGEAHGYFERTFVAFGQYPEWAAKAYLRDAECLVRMGARDDAKRTLQEALDNPGYAETAVIAEIRTLHQSLL